MIKYEKAQGTGKEVGARRPKRPSNQDSRIRASEIYLNWHCKQQQSIPYNDYCLRISNSEDGCPHELYQKPSVQLCFQARLRHLISAQPLKVVFYRHLQLTQRIDCIPKITHRTKCRNQVNLSGPLRGAIENSSLTHLINARIHKDPVSK